MGALAEKWLQLLPGKREPINMKKVTVLFPLFVMTKMWYTL